MRYNNYHKHTHYSNIRTLDVVAKPIDYINRAKELGHTTYFTTEHGFQGNIYEAQTLCEANDIRCIYGVEAYYVDDVNNKEDRSNYHLMLVAMTASGRKQINKILSLGNTVGFYYKPRIDLKMLLSLNPQDVVVTTACVAGRMFKEDWKDKFFLPVFKHFGNNFYLEIQNHDVDIQKEYNKLILQVSEQYGAKLIHANDSHYILPEDSIYRDKFLKGKGIVYEDESNFILDYPDSDIIIERYRKQGIVQEKLVLEALNNTLVFDNAEPINIDKEFKIPKVVEGNSFEILKEKVYKAWAKEKYNIDNKLWKKYEESIDYELDIVEKCGMADYFLLDNIIVNKAINEYGAVITRSGRGCFTGEAPISTIDGFKKLQDVKAGDYVFDVNGELKQVLDTYKYDIEEPMIKIEHNYNANFMDSMTCTLDHKIRVYNNGIYSWKQAKDLTLDDYLVSPILQINDNKEEIIDLNKYNIFNYDYDDEYIYEYNPYRNNEYKYSPTDISQNTKWGKSVIEKIANGIHVGKNNEHVIIKDILDYTGFKSIKEYQLYIKKCRTLRIKRYIEKDEVFNTFVGLMYGDGCCEDNKRCLSLAINNTNHKNSINRKIFIEIASRIGLKVHEDISKTRKLTQLYMRSNVFTEYIKKEMFLSKKGRNKTFNKSFLFQSEKNRAAILHGLILSDGSVKDKSRISFDNGSLSLINAFKILCESLNEEYVTSLGNRKSWITSDGYKCKDSYKLRIYLNACNNPKRKERILIDGNNKLIPIKSITILPKAKHSVYDLKIAETHSYVLYNVVVHNSSVSFYINKLLGLTEVDRISAPIKLYPTRFMSAERILSSRSLPDIDLNFADVDPVIKASKDVLGEDGIYYMIAYKPLQESSAFRLWCKASGLNIEEYDEVAKNLDNHLEDKKWKDLIEQSKVFRGVIESVAPSPCSFCLSNLPISEEIGLIKVGDIICCALDGYNCDVYKYLKND